MSRIGVVRGTPKKKVSRSGIDDIDVGVVEWRENVDSIFAADVT